MHLGVDIALVSEEGAVRVVGLDILQEMEVVHARPGQVERMDDPAQPADGVQLVSVVIRSLARRRSVGGGFPRIFPVHRAALGTCHPAYLYRHGIDAETIRPPIHLPSHPLTDALAKRGHGLAPVVVLPAGYEVGHLAPVFFQSGKQQGLDVEVQGLGRQASGDHLQVGEPGRAKPGRGTFPCSLAQPLAFCLQMSRNFANIAYKLCIWHM